MIYENAVILVASESHVSLPNFGKFCQLIQKLKWGMEHNSIGHAVAQLVEALLYKPEGRGFDRHWCYWNISLT
jgi:hypothetical protein